MSIPPILIVLLIAFLIVLAVIGGTYEMRTR